MQKIMLEFDNGNHPELKDYLLTLKGIKEADVTIDDGLVKVTVSYDEELITPVVILSEIELFLDIIKNSCLYAFDKFEDTNEKYHNTKQHVCCEYCHAGFIEDLLKLNGVSRVATNYLEYAYRNAKEFTVDIDYNSNKVTKEELDKVFNDLSE